jgi:hypothetical protein
MTSRWGRGLYYNFAFGDGDLVVEIRDPLNESTSFIYQLFTISPYGQVSKTPGFPEEGPGLLNELDAVKGH